MVHFGLVKGKLGGIVQVDNLFAQRVGVVAFAGHNLETGILGNGFHGRDRGVIHASGQPNQRSIFSALVHWIHAVFGAGVEQGKVNVRKLCNLLGRQRHSHHFAVAQLAVIGNGLKIVVANLSSFARRLASRVARPARQFRVAPFQQRSFRLDKLVLNVPKTTHAKINVLLWKNRSSCCCCFRRSRGRGGWCGHRRRGGRGDDPRGHATQQISTTGGRRGVDGWREGRQRLDTATHPE
mmetsp:Transcript_28290/g.77663  ORF Transcript_28290/g.77663 Transcript_28290/m.77663 type:complete len:238 (+) Transcript_28290:580-1293(+)